MMILRSAGPSPFGRKVKIAAAVTGHGANLSTEATDTLDPADSIRDQNPLGKIPTLVLTDGTTLFDSRVICEYLSANAVVGGDGAAATGAIIPDGAARWAVLREQAIGDGIMDAGVVMVYEKRMRPEEKQHAPWVSYQQGKVDRALAVLNAAPPAHDAVPTIGQISIACALGYLDFRFDGAWRNGHHALVSWLDGFEARVPSFDATRPAA